MSLLDKIEELQKKPESYKRKILAVLMVTLMSIIIFVWLSAMDLSLGPSGKREQKKGVNYAPFSVLKETVKESAAKIKNSFNGIINQLKND